MAEGDWTVIGKVKWWGESKGYGFITTEEGGDVFVHYKEIDGPGRKNLMEGQAVEFGVKETPKGPRAINVKLVTAAVK
jgi:cold shock protein